MINFSARIIVDQSWPYTIDPDVNGQSPISINDSIDMTQFETTMTSVHAILRRLNMVGQEKVHICKMDWEDAYKVR